MHLVQSSLFHGKCISIKTTLSSGTRFFSDCLYKQRHALYDAIGAGQLSESAYFVLMGWWHWKYSTWIVCLNGYTTACVGWAWTLLLAPSTATHADSNVNTVIPHATSCKTPQTIPSNMSQDLPDHLKWLRIDSCSIPTDTEKKQNFKWIQSKTCFCAATFFI